MIVLGLVIFGVVLVVFLVIAWKMLSAAGKAGKPGQGSKASKGQFDEGGATIFALAFALILMAGAALHH